jgi:hypothetical protein
MKKVFSLIVVLVLVFAFAGVGTAQEPLKYKKSDIGAYFCGYSATCGKTIPNRMQKVVVGQASMTASSITVTNLPFETTQFVCTANDVTAANAVKVATAGASSVTFSGTTTDTINYHCVGR